MSSRMSCCRLLGHAQFRHKLLAKRGSVMVVPYNELTSNTRANAAYIQSRLQQATECPIHEAFTGRGQAVPQHQQLDVHAYM